MKSKSFIHVCFLCFLKGKLGEMAINDIHTSRRWRRVLPYLRAKEEKKKDTHQVIQRSAFCCYLKSYKNIGWSPTGRKWPKIIFSIKAKRFAQIEALESDAALLEKSSTPLDELAQLQHGQSFSAQQFTFDTVQPSTVTEDDIWRAIA